MRGNPKYLRKCLLILTKILFVLSNKLDHYAWRLRDWIYKDNGVKGG